MKLGIRLETIAVVAGLASLASAQSPCPSMPGSLVEVGSPSSPNYVGFQFSYSQDATFSAFLQASGIAIADYNNDGYQDMAFAGGVTQRIFLAENLKNGKFADVAVAKGLTNSQQKRGAVLFFDYDNDGDLDLTSLAHATGGTASALVMQYRNSGAAGGYAFNDVTTIASFALDPNTVKLSTTGVVGGMAAGDYDQDGYLDVIVTFANTHLSGIVHQDMWRLFSNQPNPNGATNNPAIASNSPRLFVDRTVSAGLNFDLDAIPSITAGSTHIGCESWQPTFVDIDNDGWPDLHVAIDFGADFMFMNQHNGSFTNVAPAAGLCGTPPESRNEMGSSFADVDNDGDLDIQLTNVAQGVDADPTKPKIFLDRFYRNDSSHGNLKFVDMAPVTGVINSEWGWGSMAFDYENDGDLDPAFVSGYRFADDPNIARLHLNQWPQLANDGASPAFCDASALVPQYSHLPIGDDLSRNIGAIDFDNDGDLDLAVGKSLDTTIGGAVIQRHEFFLNTQATGNDWLDLDLVGKNGSLNTVNARIWVRTRGLTQHRQIVCGSSFHDQASPRQHFGLGQSGAGDLKWIIVRWPGKNGWFEYFPCKPSSIQIDKANVLQYGNPWLNALGDLDVDGRRDLADLHLLLMLIVQPALFDALHPDSPGRILGDIDQDNAVTPQDLHAWFQLH